MLHYIQMTHYYSPGGGLEEKQAVSRAGVTVLRQRRQPMAHLGGDPGTVVEGQVMAGARVFHQMRLPLPRPS